MELNRARKLGIIYTIIFSILHIGAFLIFPLMLDGSSDGRKFRRIFWEYIDYILPVLLVFGWLLGRRFGEKFFLSSKSQYWTCYNAIFYVTGLAHWLFVAYYMLMNDFREISFNSILGSAVLGAMIVIGLNMFPTLVTAEFMRVIVKRVKK